MEHNKGPLSGYRILDLTQFESGTVCTETMAWMGAEVWKVERPKTGELGRYSVVEPDVDNYGFIILNMNKKSITCNLKTPEGLELMKKAIRKVDVFIENMGPGSIERLGLGYEECKKWNPKLIYAQIKGFGLDGPYAEYPAFNPIATATGTLCSVTGMPDGVPMQTGLNIGDSGAGIMCALSIVAALLQRETQGVGQRIQVAMQDVVIGLNRSAWEPYYRNGGVPPKRPGNGMPMEDVAPAGMFPCSPGGENDYVHIYCSRAPGSRQWEQLCRVIGREDMLEDPRFATPQSRYPHREEINRNISAWTSKRTKQEVMDILCKQDIPCGAVLDCGDITRDPYYLQHGVMAEVDHRQRGKIIVPGFAPRMSENHVAYECSPGLGEHNREIYGDVLGLTEQELEELKAGEVI